MKKFILLAIVALSATSAFAANRFLGTMVVGDRDRGDGVRINSCDGRRDDRLRSITLVVRGDGLNLRQLIVQLEDYTGRPTRMGVGQVRPGFYPAGSRITLDMPGMSRCVQDIRIVGDSIGGGDNRRPGRGGRPGRGNGGFGRPTPVDVYGDIVYSYGF